MLNSFLFLLSALTWPFLLSLTVPQSLEENAASTDESLDQHSFADHFSECPKLPPRAKPPKHIKDLRPDDIGVIMALGDSLMTGLNSRVPHKMPYNGIIEGKSPEFRGGSFVMGGDPDSTSVGKMLAHYNPSLAGLSHGNTSLIYCYGPICPAGSRFVPFEPEATGLNAAQSGSWTTIHNTYNQLKYLDRYFESFTPKSVHEPWKLLFVELGFNNVCLGCVDWARTAEFSSYHYETHIRALLDGVRSRFPKTFVVVMAPFNMSQLHTTVDKYEDCRSMKGTIVGCLCNDRNRVFVNDSRQEMDILATEYNQKLEQIALEYQKENYTDFTVVYDPGLSMLDVSNGTLDIISGADCFHPSHQSHNRAGVGVWNNLFLPQNRKRPLSIKDPVKVYCPNPESRFWSG